MPILSTQPNISTAFRKAGTVLTVAAIAAAFPAHTPNAYAFELFGIHIFGDDKKEEQVINPVSFTLTFETGTTDSKLQEALENTSLLYQNSDEPVSGDLGLVIRARDDRDRLIAALYENARYGGVVNVAVNGIPVDQLPPNPDFSGNRPVPVTVKIEPGPTFTLGKISLVDDAASLDPENYDLVSGGAAGSLVILKAAEQIVTDLKQQGRPLAQITSRDVIANHDTQTVDVMIAADSGPQAPLGVITVSGSKAVNAAFIERYSRLRQGQTYSPQKLNKASERLRKLGVFSSVNLKQADRLSPEGELPIEIAVSEGKQRYFGVGATVSSIDGFGIQGYWGHRNLFGQAEALRIEGSVDRLGNTTELGDLDYSAGITFTKPGAFFPAATLSASVKASTANTTSYDLTAVTAQTSLAYELTDVDTVSGGVSLRWSDIDDAFGSNDYLTFSTPFEYVRDTRDSTLDPTEGYRASISATPSYEINGGAFFSSFEGSIAGYQSLGAEDRLVLAGKLDAGTLIGGDTLAAIPADRRFFAGGGGSVRGYAFEEISPYNGAGDATGGRSYALASFEARIKVTDSIGIVPFVDAGSVTASNIPDFSDIRLGAGIGLRYATPFGPIRLDVAMPLNPYDGGSKYGIYAGIGQSF